MAADERVIPGKTAVGNVQKHIARYNLAMQFAQDNKVLDIACGSGYGTKLLSWVAKEVHGVDVSKEAYDTALKDFGSKNSTFYLKDFYEYTPKSEYDAIVCFETMEHLEDLKKAENKLLSMLKPGGVIIFSLPLNEEPEFNEHHKHTFTVEQARKLFSEQETLAELIQFGVSFFNVIEDWKRNFSYYICVKQK